MHAVDLIRAKRDGERLPPEGLAEFMRGVAGGTVGNGQLGAFAMAVWLRGMDRAECAALTRAMRDSGGMLDWTGAALGGPLLDKHSTGGVGDLASLVLAPLLAACGAFVPMVSGRGLGHTGGTLDKLSAIPGYVVDPHADRLRRVLREAGCAIIAAGPGIAPADRRLYAVRDVTATVDSLPLIVASILSKKLAAGLDALVLDVKTGSGAQTRSQETARQLARLLVDVAVEAGLPTRALVTAMDQPLAGTVGNALELRSALDYLRGDARPPRLHALVLALGAELLVPARLATDAADAHARLEAALADGAAAERLARMVAGLGGPADLVDAPDRHLACAPWTGEVAAPDSGVVTAIDARMLGEAVVDLGGGRVAADAPIDVRVGLGDVRAVGDRVAAGDPLARVHAADGEAGARAVAAVRHAFRIANEAPAPSQMVLERVLPEAVAP
jgi:thymidine phosphorylase